MGALTQVDISITAAMRTVLTVTNKANSASTGNAYTQVVVTVTDPLLLLSVGPDFYSPSFAFSLNPGQSVTSGQISKSGTDLQSFVDPNILAEFTGPGNIILNAQATALPWIVYNGGNTEASQVTEANATGTVTYYYDTCVIPEPAAPLLAAGPLLLGLAARTR